MFASVQPSAATVHRTVAFRSSNLLCEKKQNELLLILLFGLSVEIRTRSNAALRAALHAADAPTRSLLRKNRSGWATRGLEFVCIYNEILADARMKSAIADEICTADEIKSVPFSRQSRISSRSDFTHRRWIYPVLRTDLVEKRRLQFCNRLFSGPSVEIRTRGLLNPISVFVLEHRRIW